MFTSPVQNLKAFGIKEDSIVADLGAGTGFYTLAIASIANKGKVYAVDMNRDFLSTILKKSEEENLHNVDIIWGDIEKRGGTKLSDLVLDCAIVSNVFSTLSDTDTFLKELQRILKNKGRVLFVDWSMSYFQTEKKIISKEEVLNLFTKNNFTKERVIDAGEHHYGIIFFKN